MVDDHDLLVRIDERVSSLHDSVAELKDNLCGYVTRKEFLPVRNIVYGACSVIGMAIIGTVLSLILIKK